MKTTYSSFGRDDKRMYCILSCPPGKIKDLEMSRVFSATWNLATTYKAWFSWVFFPFHSLVAQIMAYEATVERNTEILVEFDCRENPGRRLHAELAAMLIVPLGQHKNAETEFMVSKPTRGRKNTPHFLLCWNSQAQFWALFVINSETAPFQIVFTI